MDGSPSTEPPPENTSRNHSSAWSGESTQRLLERAQTGDDQALEQIFARYLPRLMRWATGRLPRAARDVVDTGDLVQDSLLKVVRALRGIRGRYPATFPTYLRTTILNRLRDEARRSAGQPRVTGLDGSEMDPSPSPLEESIGRELAADYEQALLRLDDDDRAALFLRIEMGLHFQEVADAMSKPSPDAARMAVNRAVIRLAREMHDARQS